MPKAVRQETKPSSSYTHIPLANPIDPHERYFTVENITIEIQRGRPRDPQSNAVDMTAINYVTYSSPHVNRATIHFSAKRS
jgi:hypothetical protein